MPLRRVDEPPPQTELPEDRRGKLGRLKDPPDSRDFDARALLEEARRRRAIERAPKGRRTYLPPRHPQDQGQVSKCVLTTMLHRYLAAPNEHRHSAEPWDTTVAYHVAQSLDEWPGGERFPARQPGQEYYEGTSVRAGLETHRLGWDGPFGNLGHVVVPKFVHSYWRLKRWEDVLDYAAAFHYQDGGSVAWGTNWSETMFRVDSEGFLHYDPRRVAGGHATLQYHIDIPRNVAGFQNNWGLDPALSGMGRMGRYKIRLEGPDGLHALYDDDGDAYAVVEIGTKLAEVAQDLVEQGHLT